VHEVLGSPGQPLDPATRAFMEPRFGHDFSKVRVHSDPAAATSARSVNALAYTVGSDVAFDTGRYAPHSSEGRHLLAHELAHVVQQQGSGASFQRSSLSIVPADDVSEREADAAAEKVLSGSWKVPPVLSPESRSAAINRAADAQTVTPKFVCGPDVTEPLQTVCDLTKTTFAGWSPVAKTTACGSLTSYLTGEAAWDIIELHNQDWIYLLYRPACATQGATPVCGRSVQVDKDCHYAGSVNYVIFGVMCKLCHDYFTSIGSSEADDYTWKEMLSLIDLYKGSGFAGLATPSTNFMPSVYWASAGYRGWPAVASPSADRLNCSPTCPMEYSEGDFSVRWEPYYF
jgi:hypothetical protein